MKKTMFTLLILLFSFNLVQASEITGTISTKMNSLNEDDGAIVSIENKTESVFENIQGNQYIPGRKQVNVNAIKEEKVLVIKVLGVEFHADGSLLRDEFGRIYVIYGDAKKHVLNLQELKKYSGIKINEVLMKELEQYKERSYFVGDLIREIGQEKVFVVISEGKRHIESFEELKADFLGLEIFNVSEKEMGLYER